MSLAAAIPAPAPTSSLPQLHPLKVLHRHDGIVSFALRDDDQMRPSFAIRATALESLLPGFLDRLTRDSYCSINAGYRFARGCDQKADSGFPLHRGSTLRYLCANYVDVDYYKLRLTFHRVRAQMFDLVEDGVIPAPSMIVDSGRGMWLLWLLHDSEDTSRAHCGAWADAEFDPLMIYSQVNRALTERLRHLGADVQCSDAARYVRMPGSFSMKAERNVQWMIQGDAESVYSYTLWDMADRMGVRCRRMLPSETAAVHPPRSIPGRAVGQRISNQHRLVAVRTIMGLRGGGFAEGMRANAAYIYATCLRYCRTPISDAYRAVREMGSDCFPPLPARECDAAVRSGYRPGQRRFRKSTIAQRLNVTLHEAEVVSQRVGKPFPSVDGPTVEVTRPDGSPKKPLVAAMRRAEIMKIVEEECGRAPALRQMEAKLKSRGFEVGSYVSIREDYRVLNLETSRTQVLRANKEGRAKQGTFL